MKNLIPISGLILVLYSAPAVMKAQTGGDDTDGPPPPPAALPMAEADQDRLSELLAKRLEELPDDFELSRLQREEAYAKLLEGQRYLWSMRRMRSTNPGVRVGARMAKSALRKAVEIDPRLAEGYTALAELELTSSPQDIDEAIGLSEIAVKLDPDNFGGYRFLGRLYTIKSNLGRGRINPDYASEAISAWKQITRLDPRNAEGWAFLASFYEVTEEKQARINALRNWLASAAPVDQVFFGSIMRSRGELTPESAALELGEALLEEGRSTEAVEILTRAISDDPGNFDAVELLGQALEDAEPDSLGPVTEALRQAVFANPDNLSLNRLLAETLARAGSLKEGARVLEQGASRGSDERGEVSASYLLALGDLLSDGNDPEAAVEAYRRALKVRSIPEGFIRNEGEREFARMVIEKMIAAEKKSGRYDAAIGIIEESRSRFSDSDLTLDKELVSVFRYKGDRAAALREVTNARKKDPEDYSLLRLQASILTDLGRVEEAVRLIRPLINEKPGQSTPSVKYDDFVNYIFMATLYNQANESRQAILAATNAFSVARGEERRQIAKLTLASAQQASGDFQSAEKNLREILEASPKNPIALNNLGYLFLESGKNFEEALELISAAVKTDPKNPSYLDSLGWAYFKLGQFEKAEKNLRKALKLEPVAPTILEHLGDVLKARGKSEEADAVWRKALLYATGASDLKRIEAKVGR